MSNPALGGRMRRLAPRGSLRRSIGVLAGGHALAQVVAAISYPFLTRLYDPTEFGAFAATASLLGLVLVVTCLTFDHAVPLPEEDETAGELVILCVLATLAFCACTAVALLVAHEQILGVIHAGALASYWWVLVAAQAAGGLYLALTGWAVRDRDFGALATARLGQGVATAGTQVLTGVAGASAAGLLAGDALGRIAGAGRLSARRLRRLLAAVGDTSRARLRATARRYRRFPLVASWPLLVNATALEAPLLLLVAFYGAEVGGHFALAQRLIGAPVTLAVLSIGQVFVAEAAELRREGSAELTLLFGTVLRRLVAVGMPLMLLVPVPALLLVGPIFGQDWREAGVFIAILTPLYAAQLLTSPLGGTLTVLERQDLLLVRELVRIGLLAVAVLIAELLRFSAAGAVAMLSAGGTLAYLVYGAISWHALRAYDRGRDDRAR